MIEVTGRRQSYKNEVETLSSRCPLERQMPGDVELTVSVSMETGRDHIKTLQS